MLRGLEKGERGKQRCERRTFRKRFLSDWETEQMAVAWEEGKGLGGHLLVFSCVSTFFLSGKLSYPSRLSST